MKSLLASVRDESGSDGVDQAVRLLDDERRRYGTVDLGRILARTQGSDLGEVGEAAELLPALVKADLRRRFDSGETPEVADYLERFPQLCLEKERVVSLIYEEFCLREELGARPDLDSFCDRYPDWKDSLLSQLEYHRLFSQANVGPPPPPRFPRVGETFEHYELSALVGEGGASRVFVARDERLGGKQVVLKISLNRGDEAKAQGRLDHPHIVPVNGVAIASDKRMVGLAMPLEPGLPLDVILTRLNPQSRPRKASDLWRVLVEGSATGLVAGSTGRKAALLREELLRTGPGGDGWRGFPMKSSYARGVAWIGKILAEALDYAHSMETYHRDVKPGNVLVTLTRGPQLLDFNLAESPYSADRAQSVLRGGTPPYMAPEQLQAFLNPELWGRVSASADVYSLGLVLRELLTGQTPTLPPSRSIAALAMIELLDRRSSLETSVRKLNPNVPHALDAIVARALAFAPADRYPTALDLAEDLDCFLERKPLRHTRNTSQAEAIANWCVRRRRRLFVTAAALMVAGTLLYRPVSDSIKPNIASLPALHEAAATIERGQGAAAIPALIDLESRYPASSVVKLCLALALDAGKQTYDAESRFRAALKLSDVETALVPFARLHPEVALKLEEFAASRFDLAYPDDDAFSSESTRIPFYQLALEGLRIAEKLNPGSFVIQRRIARVETLLGFYTSALDRLSAVIEKLKLPDTQVGAYQEIYYAQLMRAWAATTYVDHAEKDASLSAQDALALMTRAEDDLERCKAFFEIWNFNDPQRKEFYLWRDTLRTLVTLGEVELELNRPEDAERHLVRAHAIRRKFQDRARVLGFDRKYQREVCNRLDADLKKLGERNLDGASIQSAAATEL